MPAGRSIRCEKRGKMARDPTETDASLGKLLLFALLVLIFVGLMGYFYTNPDAFSRFSETMKTWVRDAGPLGWLMVITLMVLHSFVPLPSELVALAAGMSYGAALAVFLVWLGAMLGAIVAFALARWLGRPFVAHMISPAMEEKLARWRTRQSVPALLIARLIPVLSFNLINYAAGLADVPWWTFLWTTAIGIIPMTVLTVMVGASIESLPTNLLISLLIVAALAILGVHLWWRHRTGSAAADNDP